MTTILALLDKIPATFWGVIIGSIISLGGVYLTNRASDKRLTKQFTHEREQKTKDREMELRKEIFLAAADAISVGLNSVARFSNLDISNDKVTGTFVKKLPAIAKVHVIATMDTIKALTNFTGELNAIYFRLFAKRFQLMALKTKLTTLNAQATLDPADIAKRNQLALSLYPQQLTFMRECLVETERVGKLLTPILHAARSELELPFDMALYGTLLEDVYAKQKLAIDEFVKRIAPSASNQVT